MLNLCFFPCCFELFFKCLLSFCLVYGTRFIEEDDLLPYMPKEEVDNAFPLFEGAAESKRIKKSAFRNWVVRSSPFFL